MTSQTANQLTAELTEAGLYKLSFPWPAPHPPAVYTVEAREVGADSWMLGPVCSGHEVFWRAPWKSKRGWEVRVTAVTQLDGRYRSEMLTLPDSFEELKEQAT